MKKRMIIVTALIMGTLGAGCVSVQASDTLPELTKDNALEQMMKAGETDSLVSNHKSYEATCEYILQNTKVYDYEDSEVMYVDMYGTTQMLYKEGELKYGKEGDEYLSFCNYAFDLRSGEILQRGCTAGNGNIISFLWYQHSR